MLLLDDAGTLGLRCWRGHPAHMPRSHRHSDMELNYVERGAMTYLFAGSPMTLAAGHVALFWAALPHQLVEVGADTMARWITIPLAMFLQWRLPDVLVTGAMRGTPLVGPGQASDADQLDRWQDDLADRSPERHAIMLVEVGARLRRLALSAPLQQPLREGGAGAASGDAPDKAERMARYVADHYAEPIAVQDIARAADAHPTYAMTLFRQTFGLSVHAYVTQYRLADARRLLATTDINVLDVALEAGFGSASRFYIAFKQACGQTPRAYRAALRAPYAHKGL